MATSCTVVNGIRKTSTKGDVGTKPTIVSKSWQVQVESLNVADTGAMLTAAKAMVPLLIMWDQVKHDRQPDPRSKASYARKGMAYLSDATFNFNDRENSAKSLQFTGASPLEDVGTSEATEVIPRFLHEGSVRSLVHRIDGISSPCGSWCKTAFSACQPHIGRRNDQRYRTMTGKVQEAC